MAIVYQLITADGVTFNLSGTFADGGYSVSSPPYVPDGVGFPPIKHITQDIYNMPGSLLQGIQVRPRIVDLPMQTWGNDVGAMLDARSRLINVLRWDRSLGSPPDPATLRVTVDGVAADLLVYYLSDITSTNRSASERISVMGIRLIAYDPLWRSTSTLVASLDLIESTTVYRFAAFKQDSFELIAASIPSVDVGGIIKAIAIHPVTGDVYIGGDFTGWDNIVGADYIAKWDGTDFSLVGAGSSLNDVVWALAFTPNGTLYVGGQFTNAGADANADYLAKWDGISWSAVGGPAEDFVFTLCLARDSTLYVGGAFADINSVADTLRIAKWDGTNWTAMGTGADALVYALVEGPDGSIYAGGTFNSMGGVANTAAIARWDGSEWKAVSGGLADANTVYDLTIDDAGSLYVAGDIALYHHITMWAGSNWQFLGGFGLNELGYSLLWHSGMLYVGGFFTEAGNLPLADRIARWNGSTWSSLPIDLPGATYVYEIAADANNLYLGFTTGGVGTFPGMTNIAYSGSAKEYPIITILGECTLESVSNDDSDKGMLFNMFIASGEQITIDLTPGVKSITSNFYGNKLSDTSPQSDLNSFALIPDPLLATPGYNRIGITMLNAIVTEIGDNNNQITVVPDQITGLTLENTDQGRLYVNVFNLGGGNYNVYISKDAARTQTVAETASYAAPGDEVLSELNDSGIGGTITVDAVVAADTNIVIMPPFCQFEYYNKFWSLEDAVK